MRSSNKIVRWAGTFALLAALTAAGPAAALHSVFLTVPNYSEEALTWCGPAVGEMVMEGYPGGAGCDEFQADVWAEILVHKTEADWDTDPVGLAEAMKSLCPPIGTWSVFHRADATELMYLVAFYMTHNNYPVAAVLNTQTHNAIAAHQEHWVVIKGIVTDVDPTSSSSITLEHVWYTDPAPPVFGDPPVEHFISGSSWYAQFETVTKASSAYTGEYVAVIEPPQRRGRAIARPEVLEGRIIRREEAFEMARRWIEKLEILAELEPFRKLRESEPLEPLLVNPKYGGYYLIPFSADGKTAQYAIAINAYNGEFQEAGAFAPMRYLSEKEAMKRSASVLSNRELERAKASLVFTPEAGVTSRFHPVWKVEVEERALTVRQDGRVRFWPRPLLRTEQPR